LSNKEFLNFKEISHAILFSDVLDWLNISYIKKNNELRGEGFIVSIEKNMYFDPNNEDSKGSVINFVANHKQIELREAASLLKANFLTPKKEKEIRADIPQLVLEWDSYLKVRGITPELAKEYEVGLVKQRSIVSGRIAFKVYDQTGQLIGYIGYKKADGNWFFPKGFKRTLYNNFKVTDKRFVIVTTDPFDTLRIVALGFKQTVSLLANSMTAEQQEQLSQFKHILLFHNNPENIINRLYPTSFVKAPVLSKPLNELTNEELIKLIKPSN
jgi:hypothetical protein